MAWYSIICRGPSLSICYPSADSPRFLLSRQSGKEKYLRMSRSIHHMLLLLIHSVNWMAGSLDLGLDLQPGYLVSMKGD